MTRTMTKRKSNKKRSTKLATVAAVKRMIGNVVETKQLGVVPGQGAMVKGTVYSHNITAQIIQGTADGQRAGDSIALTNLEYRIAFNSNKLSGFYQYRVLVLYCGLEVNPGANFGTTLAFSDIMLTPYTSSQAFGVINTKAVSVLHDRQIDINSQISGEVDGATVIGNINLKGIKFPYQAPADVYGKTKNLYLVVIGKFTSAAAVQPSDTGDVICNYKIVYRDA